MSQSFHYQFKEALLQSEKRRTGVLVATITTGILYQAINYILKECCSGGDNGSVSFKNTWIFPIFILGFEVAYLLFVHTRIKKQKLWFPPAIMYVQVVTEITMLTLIMVKIGSSYPQFEVMKSPVVFVYFLLIILSTLRLNFFISFFCGLLASISFIVVTILLTGQFTTLDSVKVYMILACGLASGVVALQIKKGIWHSLEQSQHNRIVTNLFGQQLSKEIAEHMIEEGGQLKSRRMDAAIMFIDIRNFTRFTIDKSPEEIVRFQNAFLNIVIGNVSRYGGVVNQIMGDGCMVTFGCPNPLENASLQAVSAATSMLAAFEKAITRKEIPFTRLGIGIHAGEVVTGNIGTTERMQYSITGTPVILASRIEQLNKELDSQLLISDTVAKRLNKYPGMSTMGKQFVKGWPQAIEVYKIA